MYDWEYTCTPLFIAAHGQQKEVVKKLARAGAGTGSALYKGGISRKVNSNKVDNTLYYISSIVHSLHTAGSLDGLTVG